MTKFAALSHVGNRYSPDDDDAMFAPCLVGEELEAGKHLDSVHLESAVEVEV